MTAPKSARDQLNQPGHTALMLIMSGSDRDKLLRLVDNNAAPFFGSTISRMPELDEDFIAHAASVIGRAHPQLLPVDNGKLWQAFQLFGKRPQPFVNALGAVLNPRHLPLPGFEAGVARLAAEQRAQDERAMEATYLALRPLERAVLWRMLEQQDRFRPYDADALAFYRENRGRKLLRQRCKTPSTHCAPCRQR